MGKKLTKDEFIKKANKIHKDKYDYSKVDYVNSNTKVCIICHEHGEFWQKPSHHLSGHGCAKCTGNARKTTEDFFTEARKVHGDKYDYTKVDYVNNHTNVCIICPEHGEFWQKPSNHLRGQKCQKCYGNYVPSTKEWVSSAHEVHNGKYDYSKVNYINNKTKVCIICHEHGEFWQRPHNHLNGNGCPKCKGNKTRERQTFSTNEFIAKSKKIHDDKYDYSKVKYVNSGTKVCIVCHEHGEFWQKPSHHLSGHGCVKCMCDNLRERFSSTKDEFISKAKEIHDNKYDYSKVDYVNAMTKVCIICPEHGEFWQTPHNHLSGKGCPKCNSSKLEGMMRKFLTEEGLNFNEQYRTNWLGLQSLDYYLPDYNIGIECQGRQHFEAVDYFGGKEGLNECKKRDKLKFKKCQKNGIKVLYYSNLGIEYPYEVFEDLDLLFKEIKNI